MRELTETEEKQIQTIMKKAEDILAESIGKYQAQRFLYLFRNLESITEPPLDLAKELFLCGKEN